jgi:hypothetical protein
MGASGNHSSPGSKLMLTLKANAVKLVVAGVDWGYSNPGAILVFAVDGDGRMYLVHEVYRTGQLIGWWTEKAKAIKAHFRPECFVCDPSEPAYIEQFNRAGVYAVAADNDIAPGIQAVESRLAVQPDGRPRLFLYDGALEERDPELTARRLPTCLREEMDAYVYKKAVDGKPIKEEPVDLHNHAADVLRYCTLWVDARQRVGNATVGTQPAESRGPFRRPPAGAFGNGAGFGKPPRW